MMSYKLTAKSLVIKFVFSYINQIFYCFIYLYIYKGQNTLNTVQLRNINSHGFLDHILLTNFYFQLRSCNFS